MIESTETSSVPMAISSRGSRVPSFKNIKFRVHADQDDWETRAHTACLRAQ